MIDQELHDGWLSGNYRADQRRATGPARVAHAFVDQIFKIPAVISVLSAGMTLEPGDIVSTGTPAGVGAAQGRFLRDGNLVEVELEGIGTLANPVRAE